MHGTAGDGDDRQGNGLAVATRRALFFSSRERDGARCPLGTVQTKRAPEMSVSARIREIEREIDTNIRAMPIWQRSKALMLSGLMKLYRDAIEVIFTSHLFFQLHPDAAAEAQDAVGTLFIQENRIRAGILWAFKWAAEFCPEDGGDGSTPPTDEEFLDLQMLGTTYEAFVDTLKYADKEQVSLEVDEDSKTIVCYEGKQATTFDPSIVFHQRITSSVMPQVSLTEDADPITSRWTAGDYRRVTKQLADRAASEENEIIIDPAYLARIGQKEISLPQPTIVWLERPRQTPDWNVFDDLVFPTAFDTALKYKLVALLDTPIIMVGDKYCVLSSDIKAISVMDDNMLRLAARIDERQYTASSQLREGRMIKRCVEALEKSSSPWRVKSNVIFSAPHQEADIVATRASDSILVELKSTLRPETPWEVFKMRIPAIVINHSGGS